MNNQVMTTENNNNKGFSLVELIIVIAIMAILVGIVGTQVIPYLNTSREAKDQQILSSWVTAAMSAYSENAAVCTDSSYTITISSGVATVASSEATSPKGVTELTGAFNDLSANATLTGAFDSTLYKEIDNVVITITPAGDSDKNIVSTKVNMIASGSRKTTKTISTTELVAK